MRRIIPPSLYKNMKINGYTIETDPDFPIEERFNLIVPLNYILGEDRRLKIYCYESTLDLAEEFAEKWADNCFDNACFDWIYARFEPRISSWGYETDPRRKYIWLYNFELTDEADIDLSLIRGDSRMLVNSREVKNKTTFDLDMLSLERLRYSATVLDGVVVSIAAENMRFDERTTEIGCETHPQYRGIGLAASNIALLSRELLLTNDTVQYNCTCRNEGSRTLAEKVGFSQVGRSYYLTCYLK